MAIAAQVSGLAHGPLVVSYAGDGWGGGVNEVFSIYIHCMIFSRIYVSTSE